MGSGPIRLHYEYNTSDISEGDAVGRNVKKIMDILAVFWGTTI